MQGGRTASVRRSFPVKGILQPLKIMDFVEGRGGEGGEKSNGKGWRSHHFFLLGKILGIIGHREKDSLSAGRWSSLSMIGGGGG